MRNEEDGDDFEEWNKPIHFQHSSKDKTSSIQGSNGGGCTSFITDISCISIGLSAPLSLAWICRNNLWEKSQNPYPTM